MIRPPMTSMERVLTTLGHKEPDRVPLFLLATMHGARELGLSIRDYFSSGAHVAEGQCRLQAKYQSDCLYSFFYAALETEAWGGSVVYREDGPPNAGEPLLPRLDDILSLEAPSVKDSPVLRKVLEATALMKTRAAGRIPVIGVVMSPFSLPVMQLGFGPYLELLHERPDLFERLMQVNEAFCVEWANAQLAAGATAICYFDPVSSSTILPRSLYLRTGFEVARRTLARINGPAAIHLASGRCLPMAGDIAQTGCAVVGVSVDEDLSVLKQACAGKLTLLGNLNGIALSRFTPALAEAAVRLCIAKAGPGGGFILSDNHGEIPWQVSDDILMAVSEAARRWGAYPLSWVRA